MNKRCACISCVDPSYRVGDPPPAKSLKRKVQSENTDETSCFGLATEIDSLWNQLFQLNNEVKKFIPEIKEHISKLNQRTRANKHKIEQLESLNRPQDSSSVDTEGVDQSIVGESEPDTEEDEEREDSGNDEERSEDEKEDSEKEEEDDDEGGSEERN